MHGDLYLIHVFLSHDVPSEDTLYHITPTFCVANSKIKRSPRQEQTPASTVRYILLFPPQSPTMATMNPNSRSQRAATPDTTVARRMAYFSAVLFVLGGLILISTSFAERNASHHTYREYKALNTTVLEDIWEQRRAFSGLKVLGDFIFCIAYLSMVPAIMILIEGVQHSSKLSSGTRLLSPCFGIVAFTVVLTFLTSAGTCKCGSWGPWRVL